MSLGFWNKWAGTRLAAGYTGVIVTSSPCPVAIVVASKAALPLGQALCEWLNKDDLFGSTQYPSEESVITVHILQMQICFPER